MTHLARIECSMMKKNVPKIIYLKYHKPSNSIFRNICHSINRFFSFINFKVPGLETSPVVQGDFARRWICISHELAVMDYLLLPKQVSFDTFELWNVGIRGWLFLGTVSRGYCGDFYKYFEDFGSGKTGSDFQSSLLSLGLYAEKICRSSRI